MTLRILTRKAWVLCWSLVLALPLASGGARAEQAERLRAELAKARAQSAQLAAELAKAKAQLADLAKELRKIDKQIDRLQQHLVVRTRELIGAEKELARFREEHGPPDLPVLREPREPWQERRPVAPAPAEPVRGKVTAVDRRLGRVVLNVGLRHGVKKGDSFIVFRGDTYVGKIVVDEVLPDSSAAQYVKEAMKQHVKVGDEVTTKLIIDF